MLLQIRKIGAFLAVIFVLFLASGTAVNAAQDSVSNNIPSGQSNAVVKVKAQGVIPANTMVKVMRDGKVVTEKVTAGTEYPADSVFIVPADAKSNLILAGSDGATYFVEPAKGDFSVEASGGNSPRLLAVPKVEVNNLGQTSVGQIVAQASGEKGKDSDPPPLPKKP